MPSGALDNAEKGSMTGVYWTEFTDLVASHRLCSQSSRGKGPDNF